MKNYFTLILALFTMICVVHSQQVGIDKVIVEVATDATG